MSITIKECVQKPRKDGMYQVYIRITQNRKIGFVKTPWLVNKKGIDKEGNIKDSFVLGNTAKTIAGYYDKLNRIDTTYWTYKDVIEYLTNTSSDISFTKYAKDFYWEMVEEGRVRTAKNYKLACQHLEKFLHSEDIMFSRLTPSLLQRWIDSLSGTARAKEMYPVNVRQIFRAAIREFNDPEKGIFRIHDPWGNIEIPQSDIPEKRALPAHTLRKFFAAVPEDSRFRYPLSELGQDVAKMVLCLAGMNTCDLFALKKTDYYDGILHYNRSKTEARRSDNAYFEIRVPAILQGLFEKYKNLKDTEWLFNFHDRLSSYDSFSANVNKGIDEICDQVGIKRFSAYSIRHTWATIAQNECGASLADVDFGLNHSSHKLAKTYVKVDFTPAWELNERVLEFLFFTDKEIKASEDKDEAFRKFSQKNLMTGSAYYQGKLVATVEDVGFSNIDQIIDKLRAILPEDLPEKVMLQIKIENKDKHLTQFYERSR